MTKTIGAERHIISDTKARARDTFLARFAGADAPCKQDPDLWHSKFLADRNQAVRACTGETSGRPCPLLRACDAWASADPPERYGVWGGRDRNKKENK